jgi:hypothetical protein
MSVTYISAELRRLVRTRAHAICEYCLIAEEDTFFGCAVDHIISEKHGGPTEEQNLAYSCVLCNQAKGSDIGSIHSPTGALVRFFNPRTDDWSRHFALVGARIDGISPIGEVTVRILALNATDRLLERQALRDVNRYPSAAAARYIRR